MFMHRIIKVLLILLLVAPAAALTTTSFYATHDGCFWYNTTSESFADIVTATTASGIVTSVDTCQIGVWASNVTNEFNSTTKYGITWDTSSLLDNITIVSARVRPYAGLKTNGLGSNTGIVVTDFAPTNKGAFVVGDFNKVSIKVSEEYTYSAWSNGYREDIDLDANGISNISLTGNTSFMLQPLFLTNGFNGTWVDGGKTYERSYTRSYSSRRPILEVTWGIQAIPISNFSSDKITGVSPLTVQFTDTSEGMPSSWFWDFGDGSNSTSQNPSHVFSEAGSYTISLQATNDLGSDLHTGTNYIYVQPGAPTVDFTATPLFGSANLSVRFTSTVTGSPTYYYWSFGDGDFTNSTEVNPLHVYTEDGYYTVSVTVQSAFGQDTETKSAYIAVGTATYGTHPFILFRNVTDTYAFQHRAEEPWSTYINATSTHLDSVTAKALYYHLCSNSGGSNCVAYANEAITTLMTFSNSTVGATPNYGFIYDLIAGTKDTGDTYLTTANDTLIRDKLASYVDRLYHARSNQSANYLSSPDSGWNLVWSIYITGLALNDYNSTGKLTSDPKDWINMGTYDMFIDDQMKYLSGGTNTGYYWYNNNQTDGVNREADYLHYYGGELSLYPLVYNQTVGNLFTIVDGVERNWVNLVYRRLPNGYSPNFGSDGNLAGYDYYIAGYQWMTSEDRAYLRWSQDLQHRNWVDFKALPYSNSVTQSISSTSAVKWLVIGNYTDEPYYHPISKNFLSTSFASLRTKWNETADFAWTTSFGLFSDYSRFTSYTNSNDFEFYGHGDLLIPTGGELKAIWYPALYTDNSNANVILHNRVIMDQPDTPRNDCGWGDAYNADTMTGHPVGRLFGLTADSAWLGEGGAESSVLKNFINAPSLGYVQGSLYTRPRTEITNPGRANCPDDTKVWNDTIYWTRSIVSPGNEYVVVIDSLKSSQDWTYKNVWALGSFNFTPTVGDGTGRCGNTGTTQNCTMGRVRGDLTIGTTPYDWTALVANPERHGTPNQPGNESFTGITTNDILWNTTNPYGDQVSLNIVTTPSANISIQKWFRRVGGYSLPNTVDVPILIMNNPNTNSTYRITAFLVSWANGTDLKSGTSISVTGTGSSLMVNNTDSSNSDVIYAGVGTSTFGIYQTDAERAIIRRNESTEFSLTIINGTYLNKSGSSLFNSTTRVTISTYTAQNGTIFNITGSGATTLKFYGVVTPTVVKKDGITQLPSGNWSMSGSTLTITATLSDHTIQFGNGNDVYTPEPLEYLYESTPPSEETQQFDAAPTSSFTSDPTEGDVPLTVSFSSTSVNATSILWTFNGAGNTSTVSDTSFNFTEAGVYNVSLLAENVYGVDDTPGNDTSYQEITVTGESEVTPIANFTVSSLVVVFPGRITVNDTSTNTPTEWDWNWGDNSTHSTTNNATHQYTKRGFWNMSLNASNSAGYSIKYQNIRVIGYFGEINPNIPVGLLVGMAILIIYLWKRE